MNRLILPCVIATLVLAACSSPTPPSEQGSEGPAAVSLREIPLPGVRPAFTYSVVADRIVSAGPAKRRGVALAYRDTPNVTGALDHAFAAAGYKATGAWNKAHERQEYTKSGNPPVTASVIPDKSVSGSGTIWLGWSVSEAK